MSTLSAKPSFASSASSRPSPSPSRTATPNSTQEGPKRKKGPPAPPATGVWSQPADTGHGTHIMTQVTFALDHLKMKDRPITLRDILDYLSLRDPATERQVGRILKQHSKVEYDEAGFDGKGSYRFRPMHNVRSGDDLLAFLQRQTTAQGIRVANLKEGWPAALDTIEALEKDGKLLVTRNKKDNSPKMVWPNDPTLIHEVDNEFRNLWHDLQVPAQSEALRNELLAFGLTPTSQVKQIAKGPKVEKKKKKVPRRGGKTTNTHMAHILKDYSHLRRG